MLLHRSDLFVLLRSSALSYHIRSLARTWPLLPAVCIASAACHLSSCRCLLSATPRASAPFLYIANPRNVF
ncbi:hypothetical protein [Methanimicrococcus blatticola]|uniref:hypothetical protein n=1 Tax=Methanimicrococcus blatticola TaxID=91560 RepID=UPI00105FD322|nr:hypothetical protein [Methanimicrococcus blatticola]MBZ3935050.1 hypothetical protein [Methanimicrococcus blatticola]MCC2508853.1 hypothetical protein [Methanimicrococcus blatticola]